MNLPKNWTKMDFYLILEHHKVESFENTVLHMIVRDYHFMYSKEIDTPNFTKIHFYTLPKYHCSIIYNLGFYMNDFINSPDKFEPKKTHAVPQPFPSSILFEA